MTSSPIPFTSKRLRALNCLRANAVPLVVFSLLLLHGVWLGLTDDEAYYWVLAQRPALGYAFHPPMVAWVIAFFQKIFQPFFGSHSVFSVRFPAALLIALSLHLGIRWIANATRAESSRVRLAAWTLAAYSGIVAVSWMMVPDLPLTLGWMLLFTQTWDYFSGRNEGRALLGMGAGAVLSLLSKFSAVLVIGSAGLAVLFYCRGQRRVRGLLVLVFSSLLALVPILIWNSQHAWGALLYQFSERHSNAHFSALRYARFFACQLVIAGPLLFYSLRALIDIRKGLREGARDQVLGHVLLFAWPAALVFLIQPAFSDFKPHWAIVVWLPFALDLARRVAAHTAEAWGRAQRVYGWTLTALVLVICQFPLTTFVVRAWAHREADPRWDVSNDMFGWEELPIFLSKLPPELRTLPVTASRYQTASQAAFALGDAERVEFTPRDLKQRDEWPDLGIYAGQEPQGVLLKRSVLFVADIRYNAPPSYGGSKCEKLGRIEKTRFGTLSKWIDVWRCEPAVRPF